MLGSNDKLVERWQPSQRAAQGAKLSFAVAILFSINLLRFPGETNRDSDWQYKEILTGHFNDWHPPAMARLWQLLGVFGAGPGPIFVFNVACYWLAIGLIAFAVDTRLRRGWGWAILAIGAWPTLLMIQINIAKDVTMAVALLLGFAVLLRRRLDGAAVGWPLLAVATVLLLLGMLTRNNAVFAVGPFLAFYFRPAWLRAPILLVIGSVVLGLALVPVSTAINHRVLMAHESGAIRSLQLFDLAGIAAHSGDVGIYGARSRITPSDIANCYTPIRWDPMGSFGRCPYFLEKTGIGPAIARDAERPQDVATLHRLSTLWATAILRHPIAYLAHRLGNFNSASFFLVPWHHTSGEVGMNASGGRGHGLLDKLLDWLHYLPLLAPIVLMTLGAILVGMLRIASRKAHSYAGDAAVALALSSTLYGLSFLILGVATDLRYFFYVMVGLPISTVIAFAGPTFVRRGTQRRALAVLFALPLLVFILTMSARLTLHPPAPKLTLPVELGASAPAAQPL